MSELNDVRVAAVSIAGALGGMTIPATLYLALLGARIPQILRVFMLSLAIVDDIGAILVVAVGYSSQIGIPLLAWFTRRGRQRSIQ